MYCITLFQNSDDYQVMKFNGKAICLAGRAIGFDDGIMGIDGRFTYLVDDAKVANLVPIRFGNPFKVLGIHPGGGSILGSRYPSLS